MKAHQELVAAQLQPVLALLAEPKLHILMTRRTVTLTMKLQLLKVLLLQLKLQPRLLKVLLLRLKLLHQPLKVPLRPQQLKVLHQQPKLLRLKLQHQPLKALLLLQKQSSWTVRCI
jgi:hypothetical protein